MRTKKLIRICLVACALDFEAVSLKANTVFWTGAADGVSWNNPGNWSNGVPPTAADNAIISGVSPSIDIMLGTNVTVQGVQCSASLNLSAGGLALTQGASQVNGNLTVGSGELLSVSGSGTSFVCPGQTTADDGNFSVSGGATISLPGLLNYNKSCNGANWTVTGANSVLLLPALTNMTGVACSYPVIQVTAGGQLQATNLVSLTVPVLSLLVDGADSLVNLPALQTCTGSGDSVSFTAQNSGEISIPQLTNAPSLAITITSGGTMTTAQFQQVDGITLSGAAANFTNLNTLLGQSSIAGVTQSFPAVTNFTDITVSGGAVVTFPNLRSYYKACDGANWTVTDPNSVLSLPEMTNLTGEACNYPVIQALAGGQLQATNLVNITQGPLTVLADGAGSLVNFPALQAAAGEGQYVLQITAQNSGEIWIPLLTNAPTMAIDLNSGGTMPTAQFQQLDGITLSGASANFNHLNTLFGQSSIDGVAQSFPALTNFTDGNITVSGGAVVTFPHLQSYYKLCAGDNWTITDPNSVLSLPELTNLTGEACSYPVIQVLAGGQLQATNLVNITQGPLTLLADGAGSLMNFPALQVAAGEGQYFLQMTAQNSGEIWIPLLTNAPTVAIDLNSGGTMPTAQFQQLDGITLSGVAANFNNLNTLSGQASFTGVTLNLPGVTNFTDGNITVSGGAVVTFPNLRSYYKLCAGDNWTITDSNSVLSLPVLTNLTGEACSYPVIQVLAGGQLQAPNLVNITQGPLTLLADGAGSLINFPALEVAAGEAQYILQMTAQNSGEIWIPLLTNAPTVAIDLNSGGAMPTAQFQQLDGITLSGAPANFNHLNTLSGQSSIAGVTQSFPAVTNFTDANIIVSGGAVVTFPDLQSYYKFCDGDNWTITDPGSVLSLPALTNLTGEACSYPTIEVSAGGDLEATDLVNITQGPLTLLVDGTGSLIDFPALESGSGENGYGLQFTAQNGGTLDIPEFGAMNLVSITAQGAGLVSMNQVQGITGSYCNITSTDSGSVIDLSSLSAFATPLGASSLIATNDGQILLNANNVFLLENVAVNWAGSANLPSAVIAENSLSLYAPAWLSYRVDVLDTRNPGNTWQFFTYVPQTNAVQQVSAQQPEPWQEFRVYPFMANPPLVEISVLDPQSSQLVLYGTTDLTYRVESALKLSNATSWQPWSANIPMTNSFRIFAPVGSTNTEEFFRGHQL